MWLIREESFLCDKDYPHGYWFDISVPLDALDDYTEKLFSRVKAIRSDMKTFLFGHLADGNLHLTITCGKPMPELSADICDAVFADLPGLGGSFSAEHGIGLEKKSALATYGDPTKMALMHALKSLLDPKGIMNPGKVL